MLLFSLLKIYSKQHVAVGDFTAMDNSRVGDK